MEPSKKWLKLTISCPEKMVESISDLLVLLSGAGVDIHPVEGTDSSDITGFFFLEADNASEVQKHATLEIAELFGLYNQAMPEVVTEIFDDQDWATSWQQFFETFEIIPGLVIKPSWEEYIPANREHVLQMDPGMAFGTGQHESTRMALLLISSCFSDNDSNVKKVLDIGTGTGILAMASAFFGAEEVLAVDNDPEAVSVAEENISINRLGAKVSVDTTPVSDIQGLFDLICVNIVHDVLVEMADDISRLLAPGGRVVLSGILSGSQEQNIKKVYKANGMALICAEHDNEWAALLLEADSQNI